MKIAGLLTGILLMILAGIVFVVCLALPAMTDNRINFQEAMLGLIPSALVFVMALALAIVSLIFVLKTKKSVPNRN